MSSNRLQLAKDQRPAAFVFRNIARRRRTGQESKDPTERKLDCSVTHVLNILP
jgi:hypothetical protein